MGPGTGYWLPQMSQPLCLWYAA